jgi:hypothetical protein
MGIAGQGVKARSGAGLRKLYWPYYQPIGGGRVSINARRVSNVDASATPSTRA